MKMWVKKMNEHGMHLLHPGESVGTAVPSQATGSMNGNVARQVGGLVGAAVHAAVSKKQDGGSAAAGGMADTMPKGDAVYVVTDQRLAAITYTVLGVSRTSWSAPTASTRSPASRLPGAVSPPP